MMMMTITNSMRTGQKKEVRSQRRGEGWRHESHVEVGTRSLVASATRTVVVQLPDISAFYEPITWSSSAQASEAT